ncbi:hypothetical protein [Streptomyces sp. NBC_00122]|uniref:hypothetical protein n=1 Tax=Streptomyces sp. NBC_00122 TaxID=2903623 RepID=UPI003253EAC4
MIDEPFVYKNPFLVIPPRYFRPVALVHHGAWGDVHRCTASAASWYGKLRLTLHPAHHPDFGSR